IYNSRTVPVLKLTKSVCSLQGTKYAYSKMALRWPGSGTGGVTAGVFANRKEKRYLMKTRIWSGVLAAFLLLIGLPAVAQAPSSDCLTVRDSAGTILFQVCATEADEEV